MSAADFLALNQEQREMVVLRALADATPGEQGRNLLNATLQDWYPELVGLAPLPADVASTQAERHAAQDALDETYSALEAKHDIRPDPRSGSTFCKVTSGGAARLDAERQPNGRRVTFARGALAPVKLHRRLIDRGVEAQFLQGRFESALRDGATYLEDAIRTLGGYTRRDSGVKLCGKAFAANTGPLADPALLPGEQAGWQQLYCGFFAVVRNAVDHRDFEYPRDQEALTHLLSLDLLVVELDKTATRIGIALP